MSVLPHVFALLAGGNEPASYLDDNFNALRNVTPTSQTTAYTTVVADHLRPIQVTQGAPISLGDASTMVAGGLGYKVEIINLDASSSTTISLANATNTLSGTTNGTFTVPPRCSARFMVNLAGTGYEVQFGSAASSSFLPSGTGAVTTDLQTRGRLWVWPEDFGAKGDGTTDDTAAIQAAIDAVTTAGGGTVFFSNKTYVCVGLVLKSYVTLYGSEHHHKAAATTTRLKASGTGTVIDTVNGTVVNGCGIIGIDVYGAGSAVAGTGIHFRDVDRGVVRACTVQNLADNAVLVDSTSVACSFSNIVAQDCVLNTTRAAKTGAMDIDGTDHYFYACEATTSQAALTDANLYLCAWVIRSANNMFVSCIGESSDVGWHMPNNTAADNRFTACRADINFGHGWEINGTLNMWSACLALNNGQATTNTYDNWQFTSTSSRNVLVGCAANSSTTAKARYGFNDLVASDSLKNSYTNCQSFNATTAQYSNTTTGSGFSWPDGAKKSLTANSATPDVTGYGNFQTANTGGTTITDFTGGIAGQEISVLCNDANTTVQHNGATIVLINGGNKKLVSGVTYKFKKIVNTWREIVGDWTLGVTADAGDAAATFQARVNTPTIIYHTAITADRAVTLSTTGAYSGAKARVVRDANCTGAFNVNVGTGPLKALGTAGTWCDVEYNGSAWVLTASGSL